MLADIDEHRRQKHPRKGPQVQCYDRDCPG
jgi:hypothetical protein